VAENRTAYSVREGEPPVLHAYSVIITPKRVALRCPALFVGAMYCEVLPSRFAWTEREAWALFLAAQQRSLTEAREGVAWLEGQIAAAQQQLAAGEGEVTGG
jgi:hypothetical protein